MYCDLGELEFFGEEVATARGMAMNKIFCDRADEETTFFLLLSRGENETMSTMNDDIKYM